MNSLYGSIQQFQKNTRNSNETVNVMVKETNNLKAKKNQSGIITCGNCQQNISLACCLYKHRKRKHQHEESMKEINILFPVEDVRNTGTVVILTTYFLHGSSNSCVNNQIATV